MIWSLLERWGLLERCDHCGVRFWRWRLESAGPVLRYCVGCFDYLAGVRETPNY